MEKKPVLHRFNLFTSKNNQYTALLIRIQQILYYAESRFWSILNHLAKADDARQLWGQKLLRRELVRFYHLIKLFTIINYEKFID